MATRNVAGPDTTERSSSVKERGKKSAAEAAFLINMSLDFRPEESLKTEEDLPGPDVTLGQLQVNCVTS